MDSAVYVTIAIFMIGVIFHSGRLSARVDKLEEWRTEAREETHQIFEALRRLERLVKGEGVP